MSGKGNMSTRRLRQDYMRIIKDPVPYIQAHPLPTNILEWHFAVLGPEDTPYQGGMYHGKLVFPGDFPFRPPSIWMITPTGRFKCNTRLCLSISDFHPDTWNPAWSVSTILTGLLSFMIEKNPTLGSIETSDYEKRLLAVRSLEFNLKDHIFTELFPELVEECRKALNEREQLRSSNPYFGTGRGSSQPDGENPRRNQPLFSALMNAAVVVGFAAFAYAVHAIVLSLCSSGQ